MRMYRNRTTTTQDSAGCDGVWHITAPREAACPKCGVASGDPYSDPATPDVAESAPWEPVSPYPLEVNAAYGKAPVRCLLFGEVSVPGPFEAGQDMLVMMRVRCTDVKHEYRPVRAVTVETTASLRVTEVLAAATDEAQLLIALGTSMILGAE